MRTPYRDDRLLGGMMALCGGLRVGIAVGAHARFTAEPTLAVVMLGVGVLLFTGWR